MALFFVPEEELLDEILKSGAFIFQDDWCSKIEVAAQKRTRTTEKLTKEEYEAELEKTKADPMMAKLGGKPVDFRVLEETITYYFYTHNEMYSLTAIEKSEEDGTDVSFKFEKVDKITREDMKYFSAVPDKKRKLITKSELKHMFSSPLDFCDECMRDAFMVGDKYIKEHFVDKYIKFIGEDILEYFEKQE